MLLLLKSLNKGSIPISILILLENKTYIDHKKL